MITSETKVTTHPDVLYTELKDGDAVLLHLQTKTYYTLNETGARMWSLMFKGLTLGEISQGIITEFDVTLDRAQESVINLANELVAAELVHLGTD